MILFIIASGLLMLLVMINKERKYYIKICEAQSTKIELFKERTLHHLKVIKDLQTQLKDSQESDNFFIKVCEDKNIEIEKLNEIIIENNYKFLSQLALCIEIYLKINEKNDYLKNIINASTK